MVYLEFLKLFVRLLHYIIWGGGDWGLGGDDWEVGWERMIGGGVFNFTKKNLQNRVQFY